VLSTDFGEISDFENASGVVPSGQRDLKCSALISEKSATLKTHQARFYLVNVVQIAQH